MPTKTSRPEDEHQELLKLANLVPFFGNPIVEEEDDFDMEEALDDYYGISPLTREVEFDIFLDNHYPVEDFPELRRYLGRPDPRHPELKTAKKRWEFVQWVSTTLRARANSPSKFPWASMGTWKPDASCIVCGRLYSLTRKDKTTCSDVCAHRERQRAYRKRQKSGTTKKYAEAKKGKK